MAAAKRDGFKRAKALRNDADEKANREQNQKADLAALNSHRNETSDLNQQILRHKANNEAQKATIMGWLPICVCLTTLVILGMYFYFLHKSGVQNNNFKLDAMVLSSVGATTVAGSFALIGYMLQGIFQVSRKPPKKKSR